MLSNSEPVQGTAEYMNNRQAFLYSNVSLIPKVTVCGPVPELCRWSALCLIIAEMLMTW